MSDVENKVLRKISGVMSDNIAFESINILGVEAACIEFFHQAGVAGNFSIQVSNSGTRWFDFPSSTLAADDAGLMWNLSNLNHRFLRVKFAGVDAGSTYEMITIIKDY